MLDRSKVMDGSGSLITGDVIPAERSQPNFDSNRSQRPSLASSVTVFQAARFMGVYDVSTGKDWLLERVASHGTVVIGIDSVRLQASRASR